MERFLILIETTLYNDQSPLQTPTDRAEKERDRMMKRERETERERE